MGQFTVGLKVHSFRRADGRAVSVVVPVDFPPVVLVGGERFRHVADGHRLGDGKAAGLYANDSHDELWYCEGDGYWA